MSKYWISLSHYLVRVCILNASIFWVSTAYSVEPVPAGEDVIVAVKKGDKVPFDGQLFDISTALRWGLWLQNLQERAEIEQDRLKAVCKTELNHQKDVAAIDAAHYTLLNTDLKERLLKTDGARAKAENERDNPPWYSTFLFGLGVGVVSTTALVVVGSQAF